MAPRSSGNKSLLRVKKAPKSTGVYFFLDNKGKVLYVGKAIDIRNRLRSHFADADSFNPVKVKLLKLTHDLTWELCGSEPEALIREAELIKKLKPRFNVLMRDDKNYFFVGLTREPFTKVFLTHQPASATIDKKQLTSDQDSKRPGSNVKSHLSHVKFIGPFTDGNSLKRVLRYLRRVIPYCTCRTPHVRECLSGTLGRCLGICCVKENSMPYLKLLPKERLIKRRMYRKNIKMLEAVLRGEKQRLLGVLKKDMYREAKGHNFEEAAILRDRVHALESVFSHAPAVEANHSRLVEDRPIALRQLQQLTGIAALPKRIEMYDMSNIQGTKAVGSMVVFADGMPDNSQYRRFRIRTVEGIDDVAMMKEVILRRMDHAEWPLPDVLCVDGGKGQISAALAAINSSKLKVIKLPILGLAKGKDELHVAQLTHDKRPTTNDQENSRDYSQNSASSVVGRRSSVVRTIPRSRLPRPLRHLFTHLQDEAHRFAITYHRKLRSLNS